MGYCQNGNSKMLINDVAVVYPMGRRQGVNGGCRLERWRPPLCSGKICGKPQPALAWKADEAPLNLWLWGRGLENDSFVVRVGCY